MWGKACSVGSSDVELVKINQWSFLEDSVRVCVSTWNASALWPSTCEPAPGSAVGQASRQERGVPCSAVAQQSRESASSAGAGQGDCRTVGAGQEECRTVGAGQGEYGTAAPREARAAGRRTRVASDVQTWMIGPLQRHLPTGSVTFLEFKYIRRTGEFDENGNDDCTALTM